MVGALNSDARTIDIAEGRDRESRVAPPAPARSALRARTALGRGRARSPRFGGEHAGGGHHHIPATSVAVSAGPRAECKCAEGATRRHRARSSGARGGSAGPASTERTARQPLATLRGPGWPRAVAAVSRCWAQGGSGTLRATA